MRESMRPAAAALSNRCPERGRSRPVPRRQEKRARYSTGGEGYEELDLAMLSSLATSVRADSGNELLAWCSSEGSFFQGLCRGYIDAVQDLQKRGQPGLNGWIACSPKTATRKQNVEIVTKYLTEHPDDRNHIAASLVAHAFAEAFPCR